MKAIKKMMMAMFVMACIGMTVACDKDNDDGGNGNDNNYSTLIQGTWQIDHATSNGQDITPYVARIQLTFNANGSGLMNDGGQTENNGFNWAISGNVITITTTHGGVQMDFNITNITSTECTFTGARMELDGQFLENIEIHMVKVNGGGGDNPDPGNNYSTLIVGTWQTTQTFADGQDITAMVGNIQLTFTADGRGLLNHNGETENNGFSWSINGSTMTVNPDHGSSSTFTIVSLDGQTCTFTGTQMPGSDQVFDEIRITMVKTNNPGPGPITGSLEGTEWEFFYSGSMVEEGISISYNIAMELSFTTATNGTLLEKIEFSAMGQTESQNENIPFSYTYDPDTHTGTLTATFTDPYSGETETNTIPFTYSPSEDAITISNPDPQSTEDILPDTLVFIRK